MKKTGNYRNLGRETIILILFSSVSKVLAFVREILLAFFFGTSALLDAYYAGTSVSTFTLFLFSGGAFVPLLISFFNQEELNKKDNKRFLNGFLIILVVLSFIFAIVINLWGDLFLVGVRNSIKSDSLQVLKISSWATVFYCISSIARAKLNSLEEYRLSGLQDFVMISIIIITIVLASKVNSLELLSYGFLLSSVGRFLVQLPSIIKLKDCFCWKVAWDWSFLKNIVKIFFPMMLVVMIPQIQIVFSRNIAAGLDEGSLSGLMFAERTSDMIKSVIAFSIGAVMVPSLTKALQNKDNSRFKELLSKSLSYVFFLSIPLFYIFLFYSRSVVSILYERGNFGLDAINLTASALSLYSVVALLSSPIFILLNAYFANKDWKSLLFINLSGISLGILTILLSVDNLGHLSTVLGSAVYSSVIFIMSIVFLQKQNLLSLDEFKEIFKILGINSLAFFLGKLLNLFIDDIFSIFISILFLFALLYLFNNKTVLGIQKILKDNFMKWKLKKD